MNLIGRSLDFVDNNCKHIIFQTIAALRASQQEPTPPPTPKNRMRASSPYANGYDNNGYNTYYEEGAKTKI